MPIDDEVEEYTCASCDYTTTNEDDLCFVDDSLLCEDCRSWCDNCEEYMSNDSSHYVEGVGDYCESCWENNTCYCERCSNTYPDSISQYHIEDRGEYWCEGCYESEGSYCEDCDQYFSRECEGCGEGGRGGRVINQYSYKPNPTFFGDDKHNLYFGLELEMEIRSGNLRESAQYIQSKVGDSIYLKDDSSIGRGGYAGFELVSHPLSFGHWTSQMSNLWQGLEYLRDNEQARSWDAESCGIHIHASRAGFKSGAHTHRWLTLIYKNAPEMMKFAGRKSDYAKFSDVWKYDEAIIPEFDNSYYTETPSRAISLMWNQRSVDTFLGLPFNIASYGLLLTLLGKLTNMVPEDLIGNLGDTHLYLNHLDQARQQIERKAFELPNLKLKFDFEYRDGYLVAWDKIKFEDIELSNYNSHPAIKAPLSN